jgi:hypothetical protein
VAAATKAVEEVAEALQLQVGGPHNDINGSNDGNDNGTHSPCVWQWFFLNLA